MQYDAEVQQFYRCLNLSANALDVEIDTDHSTSNGSSSAETANLFSADAPPISPTQGSINSAVPAVHPPPCFYFACAFPFLFSLSRCLLFDLGISCLRVIVLCSRVALLLQSHIQRIPFVLFAHNCFQISPSAPLYRQEIKAES
jgi:hypothetical protein